MSLARGTKLGHYEIVEPIGAGGMGEVYRARDTKLDRTVAIKVLPGHLSDDDARRLRFEQEARAVSKLNHPNICTLHDFGRVNGVDFMVMECIEGESLADRLQTGPLPLDEALGTAIAIGDALDKAHRQGIVHRDLKTGNVMLTKTGPKLLDFGLAKLQATPGREPDLSAVTEQKPLTEEGAILGTFQYMAPEQLEGGEVDTRTDIFAFGALVYEMVTGQKAFSGKSQASLISAIMSSEPRPIGELRPTSPRSLDRIVKRCLAKDPDDRWQSVRDIVLELGAIDEDDAIQQTSPASRTKERLIWSGLVIATAIVAGVWLNRAATPRGQTTRVVIPLPPGDQLLGGSNAAGGNPSVSISPDGRSLAYAAESAGEARIFLRHLDTFEAVPVAGTEGGSAPFFSPDGEWVGFRRVTELRKTAMHGTATLKIADFARGTYAGASWGDDGTVVISNGQNLIRVSGSGGGVGTVFGETESFFGLPQVLPGGNHVLVTESGETDRVIAVSTKSGEARTLLEGYGAARYVASGHLIVRSPDSAGLLFRASLLAVPFDVEALAVRGSPVPVVDGVYYSPRSGIPHFAVSDTGVLVYVSGRALGNALVWVDRNGNVTERLEVLGAGAYSHPRVAPEGDRIAVDNFIQGHRDVWVYDLVRGTRIRLTRATVGSAGTPVWSPDGSRVAFYLGDDVYTRAADGSTDAELVLADSEAGRFPMSWSPDGTTIAFAEFRPTGTRDIHVLPLGGTPEPVLATSFNERAPAFSPNGRFLAYVSDESGRDEVYVRPHPAGDVKWPVSTEGGTEPVWSRDGRELFYRNGYKMMAVAVDATSTFQAERPRLLFEAMFTIDSAGHPAYDVATDGEHFLMIQETEDERTQINVVLNWFAELERLVPTGN